MLTAQLKIHIAQFLLICCCSILVRPADAGIKVIEWGADHSENYTTNSSNAQVEIYVTSWCPYCRKAIAYLQSKGIKYNKYDIEKDLAAAARKKALAPTYNGIPLAVIHGKIIKGFSKQRYEAALLE